MSGFSNLPSDSVQGRASPKLVGTRRRQSWWEPRQERKSTNLWADGDDDDNDYDDADCDRIKNDDDGKVTMVRME